MKTLYWLVKREFWEHRGGFFWTPLITTGVVLLLNILILVATGVIGSGHDMHWEKLAQASPHAQEKMGAFLDFAALMPSFIIHLALFFVLFGYCMKTLSNDRVDRSILFWKSLPVSDLSTVGSKALSAIVVAPVIATVFSLLGAFLMLLIYATNAAFHGIGFFEVFWSMPKTGHLLLYTLAILPVYMAWMLPCVGWLMMCSAWANSGKVSRWALALPFGVVVIVSWLGLMDVFTAKFVGGAWQIWGHLILGVFPGSWFVALLALPGSEQWMQWNFSDAQGAQQVHAFANHLIDGVGLQYQLFSTPQMLIGMLAGLAMLYAAVWLRRWRTDY